MTAPVNQFLQSSKDTEAANFALNALRMMERGASVSGAYLSKAWQANIQAAKDPSDAMKMRRAALAQDAYDARVSSEKGRLMAAYALMAVREGNKAITAQQAAQAAQTAQEKKPFVEQAKFASLRRNVMLQAAQTAERSFKAPALPPLLKQSAKTNDQVTTNMTSAWRPPTLVQRSNVFFPDDVRVAAGVSAEAFSGLADLDSGNWWDSYVQYQSQGVLSGLAEAEREVSKVVSQEPGSAQVAEQAKVVAEQLKSQQVGTARATQSKQSLPWWVIPVGAAVAYYFWK